MNITYIWDVPDERFST